MTNKEKGTTPPPELLALITQARELTDLINTNAANSCTGFGTRDNRMKIFNWSKELDWKLYEIESITRAANKIKKETTA